MTERKNISANAGDTTGRWQTWGTGEFLRMLESWVEKIAPEHVGSAKFELTTELDYDGDTAVLRLSYTRPENDSELAARKTKEAAQLDWRRHQFEQLKREFEA